MNKELEETIEDYNTLKRNKNTIANIKSDYFFEFVYLLLNYIENSIPKEIIKEKYKQTNAEVIKIREENRIKNNATKYDYLVVGKRDVLKELLERK